MNYRQNNAEVCILGIVFLELKKTMPGGKYTALFYKK